MPTPRNVSSERRHGKGLWPTVTALCAASLIVAVWETRRATLHYPQDVSAAPPRISTGGIIDTNDAPAAEDLSASPDAVEAQIRALWSFSTPTKRLELMRSLQGYGASGAEALPLLREFLHHPDQSVRRAAIRGLAATQNPEAVSLLQKHLSDTVAIEESTEAALALATMEDPRVTPILKAALENARDATLREHMVDALVSRPPSEAGAFIDTFLQRNDVGLTEKQNLLRMTGLNSTKSAEFLAGFLESNDEQLRHGAYQGLALVSDSRLTQMLLPKIKAETDPSDRALVYEALGNQLDANPSSLGRLADAEEDDHARLRALKAWTESAGQQGVSLAADPVATVRVAELQNAAMNHPDFAERRVALFALGFVRKDASARVALEQIAQGSSSEKIRALAQGLLANPN